jgi:hypothetical protein
MERALRPRRPQSHQMDEELPLPRYHIPYKTSEEVLQRQALMTFRKGQALELSRKEQMEEGWDADAVDALRGYAPLSHDATTAEKLEWKHLKHESNQELLERSNGDYEKDDESLVEYNPLPIYETSTEANEPLRYDQQFRSPPPGYILPRGHVPSPGFVHPPGFEKEVKLSSAPELRPKKRSAVQRPLVPQRATPPSTPQLHDPKDDDALKDALVEIKALRMENERLRQNVCQASVLNQPAYSSKVFHRIGSALYLDEPRWEPTEGYGVRLLANNPIRRLEYYLDHHPEIAFAIYKDYEQDFLPDSSEIETVDGTYRSPTPIHEVLSLISPDMQDAVKELIQQIPRFDYYFPHFDFDRDIPAPYLFMYYSTPFIPEVLPKLATRSRGLIKQLQAVVAESYGHEYTSAKLQAEKGMIARKHVKYLIRPGDVLVSSATEGSIPQACIARGWIGAPETTLEEPELEEWEHVGTQLIKGHDSFVNPTSGRKVTTYVWKVPVWHWSFDGNFGRHDTRIDIMMSLANEGDSVEIRSLNRYPLQYAAAEMRSLLEKRGKIFWSLRNRRFVSYMRSQEDELYNVCPHQESSVKLLR